MFGPGRATYDGSYARVRGAINVPKGIQGRIPIIVGGNGPRVTAGLAIKFADELNFVFIAPNDVPARMADVRKRCEVEGRDPSTLRFSLYTRDEDVRDGPGRVDVIAALRETGLDRIVCFPGRWSPTVEAQERFAEDCRAAGVELRSSIRD